MRLDTKAIRARADAATRGPWGRTAESVYWPHVGKPENGIENLTAANADFIAAARTDVPALCDRVEALEAALRKSLPCDSGAPDDARCGSCVACVDLARVLEGES